MLGHTTVVHTSVPVINSPRDGIFFHATDHCCHGDFLLAPDPRPTLTLRFISLFSYRQCFFKSTLCGNFPFTEPEIICPFASKCEMYSVYLLC